MESFNLNFHDAYMDGEYIYFSSLDFNGLFRLKRGEKYAEWLGQFPGEEAWSKGLHYKIVEYNRKLFFTPFFGHGIHIYDLEKKNFKFYSLHDKNIFSFSNAVESDGKIFLIPLNMHTPFMIYDINNESVRANVDFWLYIRKRFHLTEKHFIGGFGCVLVNQKIYITIVGLSIVICYDIQSGKICLKKIGFTPRGIHYFDGLFYFTVVNSYKIVIYDEKKDIAREVISEFENEEECPVLSILKYSDKLFLMPGGYHTEVMEISFLGEDVEVKSFPLMGVKFSVRYLNLYMNYLQEGSEILFLPKDGNGVLVFDLNQKTMKLYKVECDPLYAEQCYVLSKCEGAIQIEEKMGLKMYLKLFKYDLGRVYHNAGNENIGQKIFKMCKGEEHESYSDQCANRYR
ncbi:MAG: WD40 repeat domain-containing protein [Lachnospiraceae bacterium]|jgi:hypothetical protein|nr:WD40 repeat domain-containing protein [Lachnospiraceae bacterium]